MKLCRLPELCRRWACHKIAARIGIALALSFHATPRKFLPSRCPSSSLFGKCLAALMPRNEARRRRRRRGGRERKGKERRPPRRGEHVTRPSRGMTAGGAEVNPIRNGAREFLTLRRFHIMSHGGTGGMGAAAGGTYRTLTKSGDIHARRPSFL